MYTYICMLHLCNLKHFMNVSLIELVIQFCYSIYYMCYSNKNFTTLFHVAANKIPKIIILMYYVCILHRKNRN